MLAHTRTEILLDLTTLLEIKNERVYNIRIKKINKESLYPRITAYMLSFSKNNANDETDITTPKKIFIIIQE